MTKNTNTNTNTNTLAGAYAAVRMDPVAMARHLDDPHALSEARALDPKTYLVYVESELDYLNANAYTGDAPWRHVRLSPIAPCLRPRESAWPGATVDMCVPVFPNAYHPARRAPLRPAPPGRFPYDNCYHWAGVELDVRALVVGNVVGEGDVVRLPEEERREMERHWAAGRGMVRVSAQWRRELSDTLRVEGGREDEREDVSASSCAGAEKPEEWSRTVRPCSVRYRSGEAADVRGIWGGVPVGERPPSSSSSWPSSSTAREMTAPSERGQLSHGSLESDNTSTIKVRAPRAHPPIPSYDVVQEEERDEALLPLVRLWFDFPAILEQDDIPDPRELFAERDTIVRIIEESRKRAVASPITLRSSIFSSESSEEVRGVDGPGRDRRFRPMNVLRRIRVHVRQFVVRTRRCARMMAHLAARVAS